MKIGLDNSALIALNVCNDYGERYIVVRISNPILGVAKPKYPIGYGTKVVFSFVAGVRDIGGCLKNRLRRSSNDSVSLPNSEAPP